MCGLSDWSGRLRYTLIRFPSAMSTFRHELTIVSSLQPLQYPRGGKLEERRAIRDFIGSRGMMLFPFLIVEQSGLSVCCIH